MQIKYLRFLFVLFSPQLSLNQNLQEIEKLRISIKKEFPFANFACMVYFKMTNRFYFRMPQPFWYFA